MIPWELIDKAAVPDGAGQITLHRRGEEYSIRIDGLELMNSRRHGSEEALAEIACKRIAGRVSSRILVGGLGMGFTLAAALANSGSDAQVVVVELIPAVVRWNREHLGQLAGCPLDDPRVCVVEDNAAVILRKEMKAFDAILLDVDNGPDGLTRRENDQLYQRRGLAASFEALKPGGVMGVWSAGPDAGFKNRLKQAGFQVDEIRTKARGRKGGAVHTLWMAVKPG